MRRVGGRRRRRSHAVTAEINLTNLIDVAFVLLIIFMITAPILQGGVELNLPKANATPITSPEGVLVSVQRDGKIHIGDVPVSDLAEFERIFPGYVRDKNARQAYVRGDRDVPYGRVLEVIGLMNKLDVAEVGLVAEPIEERR